MRVWLESLSWLVLGIQVREFYKQWWGRLKLCFLGLLPRPRIILCAWWTSLNMSFCAERNWALREHLGAVGTHKPHKLMVKIHSSLCLRSDLRAWLRPVGTFPLIFAGQGCYKCIEGEQGWALQAGQSFQTQLAEVEPGQSSYTCEMKVLLLLWLSDMLTQEQKCLGSKPAMCLLSVHLLSTKEGVSQA